MRILAPLSMSGDSLFCTDDFKAFQDKLTNLLEPVAKKKDSESVAKKKEGNEEAGCRLMGG